MDTNELLRKVGVYATNTSQIIAASTADPKAKQLAMLIAEETCGMMAAIINDLDD